MKTTLLFVLSIVILMPSLVFAQAQWINFTTANGLPNDDIGAGLLDSQGNVWFATGGGGAVKFNGSIWTKYDTSNSGIASNFLFSIAEDSSGNMWFGTIGKGASKFNGTTWTTYDSANGGLYRDYAYSLAVDDTGDVWVGSIGVGFKTGGVNRFNGAAWTVYDTSNSGLVHPSVRSLFVDDTGAVWIGTKGAGASKFDGTTWTTYDTSNGLIDNIVFTIQGDLAGNIWFGTDNGVSKFDGTTWTNYTTSNGLINNIISQIVVDSADNKWFATLGGVSKFDGTTWTNYTTANGLIYNDTRTVIIDRQGNVWFGTQHGVSRLGAAIGALVSIPANILGKSGDTISVPVNVSRITKADSVLSFQFALQYNDSVIHYIGFDTTGTGKGSFSILDTIVNGTSNKDSLLISAASTVPADSGIFIRLKFKVDSASTPGDSSVLDFRSFTLNEGSPVIWQISDGLFLNKNQILYGDINQNGIVNATDASAVLRYTIGGYPLDVLGKKIADVSGNGFVYAYDAALILRRSVGFISTFPVGNSFMYPKNARPAPVPKGFMEIVSNKTSSDQVIYHIWIKQAEDVLSGNFTIRYNSEQFSFQRIQLSEWSKGFTFSTEEVKGILNIALAGAENLQGDGILLTLYFTGKNEGDVGINILQALLNETSFNSTITASGTPAVYDLSQNYPNPFNPSTFIKYQLPEASNVTLIIYNILGQRVKTLINKNQPIGYYNIVWDGSDNNGNRVASGIYFYRLQTKGFNKTRKMLVLK